MPTHNTTSPFGVAQWHSTQLRYDFFGDGKKRKNEYIGQSVKLSRWYVIIVNWSGNQGQIFILTYSLPNLCGNIWPNNSSGMSLHLPSVSRCISLPLSLKSPLIRPLFPQRFSHTLTLSSSSFKITNKLYVVKSKWSTLILQLDL